MTLAVELRSGIDSFNSYVLPSWEACTRNESCEQSSLAHAWRSADELRVQHHTNARAE